MSLAEAPLRTPALEYPALPGTLPPLPVSRTRQRTISWVAVATCAVVIAGLVFRVVAFSDLWLDEALTVNTARLPLSEIPSWLQHDGAPPLYYFLLHGWTTLFGTTNVAVRSLSALFSIATLPLIFFAGRRLGGKACAWAAVVVLAMSSFAIRFATETRMYSLVAFLVVLGYLALHRALERPSFGRVAAVAAITTALLYTQYWALYVLVVTAGLIALRAWRGPEAESRRAARAVMVGLGVSGIAFLPWLPSLLFQSQHIRADFGGGSGIRSVFHDTLFDFSGGPHLEDRVLSWIFVALLIVAVLGLRVGLQRVRFDRADRVGARPEALVIAVTLLLGAIGSYASGAVFYARYASVIFPLFVLVLAYGVTRFTDRRLQVAVLALITAAGLLGGYQNAVDHRTDAARVADVISARGHPGDVIAYCPDMVGPAVSRLVQGEAAYNELTFPFGGPKLIDWVDYIDHRAAADPTAFASRVERAANPRSTIWLVDSTIYLQGNEGKCEVVRDALARDRTASVVVSAEGGRQEYLELVAYRPR